MSGNISYKTDIRTIKHKIYVDYVKLINNYIGSGEYSKVRNKRFFKIVLFVFFPFLFCCLLIFRDVCILQRDFMSFSPSTVILFIISIIYASFVYYFQNRDFKKEMKTKCSRLIFKKFFDINYVDDGEKNLSSNKLITHADIDELGVTTSFNSQFVDDTYSGMHKDVKFAFKDIILKSITTSAKNNTTSWNSTSTSRKNTKTTAEFTGLILKVFLNYNFNGCITVKTKDALMRSKTFVDYFVLIFLLLSIPLILLVFNAFPEFVEKTDNNFMIVSVIFFISSIISFIGAKPLAENHKQNVEAMLQNTVDFCGSSRVPENISIKVQGDIILQQSVYSDFAKIINKLQSLYLSKDIVCILSENKVLLSIRTRENLFEQGNLLVSPTDKKTADRFVSQFTGIFILVDFIATAFNGTEQK